MFCSIEPRACTKCQEVKDVSEFYKQASKKDGLRSACKACQAVHSQQYYQQNREALVQRKQQYYEQTREARLQHRQQYYEQNREAILQYRSTVEGRAKAILHGARRRSQSKGLEFDLDWQFVASLIESTPVCPLLGIPLVLQAGTGKQPDSPSLDRIDSYRGYTRDNVWIVSWRANKIKSDATLEELKLLAKNLEVALDA